MSREKKRLSSPKNFPQGRHVRLVHPLQTAPTPPPPRCPCPPLPLQTKVPLSQIISQFPNFQDFCRQENLFDLPWRASSLRVWPLRSRTDQTSRVSQDGKVVQLLQYLGEEILFFGFQVETRHLEGHREPAGRENAAPRLSSLHRGEDQEVLARPPRRPGELPS